MFSNSTKKIVPFIRYCGKMW